MPQLCTICHHGERMKIELALRQKRPLDMISRKHSVTPSSIKRHRTAHMVLDGAPATSKTAVDDSDEALFKKFQDRSKLDTPDGVLTFAQFQMWRLERIVDKAEADGDLRTAVAAINSTLKTTTELFARYQGLINDGPRIDQSTKIFTILGSISEDDLRAYISQGPAVIALPVSKGGK